MRVMSEQIAKMRIRLTAVVTELDRWQHNATGVKHLARKHTSAVAAPALMLVAIVATAVAILRVLRMRKRRRPDEAASHEGTPPGRAAGVASLLRQMGRGVHRRPQEEARIAGGRGD